MSSDVGRGWVRACSVVSLAAMGNMARRSDAAMVARDGLMALTALLSDATVAGAKGTVAVWPT